MGTRGSELLHKLNAAVDSAQGNGPCKLCVALDDLDKNVAKGVRQAIAARRPDGKRAVGTRILTRILQESGIDVGHHSVDRHLRENHNE